jgi:hypothetical protein
MRALRLEVHIDFSYNTLDVKRGVYMDAEKWAELKAREIKRRRDEGREQTQKFLAEESLRKAHADGLWDEVRSALDKRATLLSRATGDTGVLIAQKVSNDLVILTTRNQNFNGQVNFNRETLEITATAPSIMRKYTLAVVDGKPTFYANGRPMTADNIAEELLNDMAQFL